MSYQLQNLSPPEFTDLTADLLGEELGVRLSRSPEGPDGGIDLLKAGSEPRPEVVVQCKHYLKSSFATLKRDLKKEQAKVKRLDPRRYIVVTSRELTVARKQDVKDLFPDHLLTLDDVFAGQDIDGLLRRHDGVVRNHYKLWLGSTAFLSKVLHQGTSVWHQELMAKLEEHKQVYVQTPQFSRALGILNKHHIVLIAGGPGVGKTTLANVLCAHLVVQGFELREIIDLEHDIKDLPEQGNVVLYYDDFLGHSVWRDTSPGSEKRLESLIRLAERNSRFWLILTSRTYLLEDAKKVSNAVEQRLRKQHEVVLFVDELSVTTRAKILYNHLYFNRVSAEACQSLTDWKRLNGILKHANFNPRIIEYVAKSAGEQPMRRNYVDFIEKHLKQPTRLYEAAIRDRIGIEARDLLFVIHVVGEPAELHRTYELWKCLRLDLDKVSENREVFNRKTKALDANLVKLSKLYAPSDQLPRDGLSFYNPGVGEMVRDLLWRYDDRWTWFCRRAVTCNELLHLARCNPDARPFPTQPGAAVTLPGGWYDRWIDIVNSGTSSANDTLGALGQTIALRVWDEQCEQLLGLLALVHDRDYLVSVPWSLLGVGPVTATVREALSSLPWLSSQLKVEVDEFVMGQTYGWDSDEAGELFSALSDLGAYASVALMRLEEAGRDEVESFLTAYADDEEISEHAFEQASSLNERLRLGLDSELYELETRIQRSPSVRTNITPPMIGDDALSEAEIRAMFTSLAGGRRPALGEDEWPF